jgi:pyruvate kinase
MDLQGPKLRIGRFDDGKVSLVSGCKFILDLNPDVGNSTRVNLPHPEIFNVISGGAHIFLDDGKIKLKVLENDGDTIETEVIEGGILSNRKGVNVPDVVLPISALTEKDKTDIRILHDITADWVAISFVQSAEDIMYARSFIDSDVGIIAKIEKPVGVQKLDSILEVSDAVMVARGDLGIEMPFESIPAIQTRIISMARDHSKPVIVATQMLESMLNCHIPTRAEVTDVAFAVGCKADAVMLSAETAAGNYPVDAVKIMAKIVRKTEDDGLSFIEVGDNISAMSRAVKAAVEKEGIKFVVTFTETGRTAIEISNSRLNARIIALTPDLNTMRRLSLVWGVTSIMIDEIFSFSQMRQVAQEVLFKHFDGVKGDKIALVAGIPFRSSGETNVLHIFELTCDSIS